MVGTRKVHVALFRSISSKTLAGALSLVTMTVPPRKICNKREQCRRFVEQGRGDQLPIVFGYAVDGRDPSQAVGKLSDAD